MRRLPLVLVALALTACAITQEVKPVRMGDLSAKAICVRENPGVKRGFLNAYRVRLENKGFQVTLLKPDALVTACPLTSTYTANWRWDLALYMVYAEIVVYRNGDVVGRALYDAMGGGGRPDKFIHGTTRINELVDHLFPG